MTLKGRSSFSYQNNYLLQKLKTSDVQESVFLLAFEWLNLLIR
jgi:hypothetical protein